MSAHWQVRIRDEGGVALLIALMATLLLTALGTTLVILTMTETAITANYRDAQGALYSADAGVERAVQDLLTVLQWNDVLAGSVQSSFVDTTLAPTRPDGSPLDLVTTTTNLQSDTDALNLWGANNPVWRLHAYGPLTNLLPTGTVTGRTYVAVWAWDADVPRREHHGLHLQHPSRVAVSFGQPILSR